MTLKSILVVGPAWIGDMVMAQSLLKSLKQQHPEAAIDVLAPGWSLPLISRMPEVREGIAMPLGHGQLQLGTRRQLGHSLRDKKYDWAITLPITLKSALIPFWSGAKKRTGFTGEMRFGLLNDRRKLDKQKLPMMVQRYLALGQPKDAQLPVKEIPIPRLTTSAESQQAALQRLRLDTDKPILALCPGAEYGPAKRWPLEYFAAVAKQKIVEGWQVWVFGSEKDAEAAAVICDIAGQGCKSLAGKTELVEAIDLLACATRVISNDSGLMHVSAALGRPLIAIFGSSDPSYTPPLGDNAEMVSLGMSCSPCFKRECPYGHYKCLKNISPDKILEKLV